MIAIGIWCRAQLRFICILYAVQLNSDILGCEQACFECAHSEIVCTNRTSTIFGSDCIGMQGHAHECWALFHGDYSMARWGFEGGKAVGFAKQVRVWLIKRHNRESTHKQGRLWHEAWLEKTLTTTISTTVYDYDFDCVIEYNNWKTYYCCFASLTLEYRIHPLRGPVGQWNSMCLRIRFVRVFNLL